MKEKPVRTMLPRGRVAQWSREQLDKLTTIELRALFDNATRLNEAEIATMCDEILSSRPRGRTATRRLVTWRRACELHGVSVRSRKWSRGGIRSDGAVVMGIIAEDLKRDENGEHYLLWAPNQDQHHPWSDTPGGKERLEHCRIALERGAAEGLLTYGKRPATRTDTAEDDTPKMKVDAATILSLRVEKRGEEYWATPNAGRTEEQEAK
jgi:hypothetical protein